jgi:CRISPR system Cascade subunit CasB
MSEAEPITAKRSQGERSRFEATVGRWWRSLDERRGDRAELRRARTPAEVIFVPGYHRLARELQADARDERLAAIAGVLAHVERDDASRSFAAQMAVEHGGKARVSGLRFRRLLAIDDLAELQAALVRMIHLLDRTAPVADLSRAVRWWNDQTKKRWAVDYYATAPSEP